MDLSIIIVNWNSKDYLYKCITSILAETKEIEFETFRKNFTYEEAEEIRAEFEKIKAQDRGGNVFRP